MTNPTQINNVKIIHLEKDNQIDSMTCETCGRSIRHALQINGTLYGLDCGANLLGWPKLSKAKIEKKAYRVQADVDRFVRLMRGHNASRAELEVAAGRVCEHFGLQFNRLEDRFFYNVYKAVK